MLNDYVSQDTTLLANSNQFVKNYKLSRNNLNFALLTKALADYDFLMYHLDEKVYLEQTIRAYDAEIDKLKQEKVDLKLRLDDAKEQFDFSSLESYETNAQIKEQKVMIQKLLHAIKTATSSIYTQTVPAEFRSLFAEFRLPHSATLEPLRFARPEIVAQRCKHGLYDCRECLMENDPANALLVYMNVLKDEDEDDVHVLKELGSKIEAMQAERDNILTLLYNRMARIYDDLCSTREHHSTAIFPLDEKVAKDTTSLIELVKKKHELEQKSIETEKGMAQLMGKAAAAAYKAREKTYVAIEQAATQLKTFERNRYIEINKRLRECRMEKAVAVRYEHQAVKAAEDYLRLLYQQLAAKQYRFDALNGRIANVVRENKLLAETIENRALQ